MNIVNFRNFYTLVASPFEFNKKSNKENILKKNQIYNFSHYFICDFNRIIIKENSIKWNKHILTFQFQKQESLTQFKDYIFAVQNSFYGIPMGMTIEDNNIILTSLLDRRREIFYNIYTFLEFLYRNCDTNLTSYFKNYLNFKLNIKYIGQTEISEDYFRFNKHEKIVNISAETIEHRPEMQVLILFDSFMQDQCIISDINLFEMRDKIQNIPFKIQKNIVEAALIRYFKPELNKTFTDTFPTQSHESYSYFYENKLTDLSIEYRNEYRPYILGNENVPYAKSKLLYFNLIKSDFQFMLKHDEDIDSFVELMT